MSHYHPLFAGSSSLLDWSMFKSSKTPNSDHTDAPALITSIIVRFLSPKVLNPLRQQGAVWSWKMRLQCLFSEWHLAYEGWRRRCWSTMFGNCAPQPDSRTEKRGQEEVLQSVHTPSSFLTPSFVPASQCSDVVQFRSANRLPSSSSCWLCAPPHGGAPCRIRLRLYSVPCGCRLWA